MKLANVLYTAVFAFSASLAIAAQPVEQYGRAAATAGNGATTTIASGCAQRCSVDEVQGRAALNYIATPRPIKNDNVGTRNARVDSVFGRA